MEHPKKLALEFLNDQFIAEIATATNDGKPSASVILFVVDDDLNLYFATHRDSFKAKNLLDNARVSYAVWEHGTYLVQADGEAIPLTETDKHTHILDQLADAATKDKDFWPPIFRISGDDYIIFKVRPTWMRMLDLSRSSVRQEDEPFIDIPLA